VTDQIPMELLGHQEEFLFAKEYAVALVTGLGGGKTWIGTHYAETKALANPGVKGLVFANTYKQLRGATVDRLIQHLEEHGVRYDFNRSEMLLTLEKECQIFLRSMENYDDIRGIEFGWAYGDEVRDMVEEAIDVVVGRLRDKRCDAIQLRLTTTPAGLNWIYERFVVKVAAAQKALHEAGGDIEKVSRSIRRYLSYRLIHASSFENPHLPEDYLLTLDTYDPQLRKQEALGLFVNVYAGNAYKSFSREHNVRPCPYDPLLPIRICFDFNASYPAPMGCNIGQVHGSEAWMVDEISIQGGTTPQVIEEFIRRYGDTGIDHRAPIKVYGDATSKRLSTQTGKSDYSIIMQGLREKFEYVELMVRKKSNPLVVDRVASTNARLCDGKRRRRLFADPKCVELIADWERVTWKPGVRQLEKGNALRTHHSDATDYFVHEEWPLLMGGTAGVNSRGSGSSAMRVHSQQRRGSIAINQSRVPINTGRRLSLRTGLGESRCRNVSR